MVAGGGWWWVVVGRGIVYSNPIMAMLSEACKPDNAELHGSNFVDCESFLESNSPDIFALCESSMYKWGNHLKTMKQTIRNYMILELFGTKKDILQNLNKPNRFLMP